MPKSRKKVRTGRLNAQKAPHVIRANIRKCNGVNANIARDDESENQPYFSDEVVILVGLIKVFFESLQIIRL